MVSLSSALFQTPRDCTGDQTHPLDVVMESPDGEVWVILILPDLRRILREKRTHGLAKGERENGHGGARLGPQHSQSCGRRIRSSRLFSSTH